MMNRPPGHGQVVDRTWLAVLITIVGVIPGLLLGGLTVVAYTFLLRLHVRDHWVPYLEEIVLLWFPELVRGLITGAVAIGLARWRISAADFRAARYAAMAFWGAIFLVLVGLGIGIAGPTLDLIGFVAFMVGFGLGLWAEELV